MFFVAEREITITGFASVTNDGYVDFLFVRTDVQRQGVALLLLRAIENFAREKRIGELVSEVSITAKPFFEKQGFIVIKEQQADIKGVKLTNYKMTKTIV